MRPVLGVDRRHQSADFQHAHHAFHVVGQDVQRHLGADVLERFHLEVCRSHPRLYRPEGMLNRLAPLAHLHRMLVEPTLYRIENGLMLPSGDPSLLAGGAAVFDGTALADVGPVAAQDQSIFLVRVAVGEPFTGRANVNVILSRVAEVLLAEAPFRLEFEVIGLGSVTVMPAFSQARISSLLK